MDHSGLKKKVQRIDECGENLTDWEIDFIADLIDGKVDTFSEKQEAIIERIFEERMP